MRGFLSTIKIDMNFLVLIVFLSWSLFSPLKIWLFEAVTLQFRWMKILISGCVPMGWIDDNDMDIILGFEVIQWKGGEKNEQYSSGLCLCNASQILILDSRHYLWGVRWSLQLSESRDRLCDWTSAQLKQSQPPPNSPWNKVSAADDIIRRIFGRPPGFSDLR